jgi:tetratricopeptide (TPR) repeat protein
MSSSSYAVWAKFDVEKELERVDEAEQREAKHKQQHKQLQAKESVVSSATQQAQQSADVLAAQAAVAALKAKKRGRKSRGKDSSDAKPVAEEQEAQNAAKLQTQAVLFAKKHELLQQIMENRRLGDKALQDNEKDWNKAEKLFETALEATKRLEELAPELLKAEEDQAKLLGKDEPSATSNQHEKSDDRGHDGHCEHGAEGEHSCGEGCNHNDKKSAAKRLDEPLPKANDLLAIINMFYKDVYVGIGTCHLEAGRLAAATEAFKEVLLRDDAHLLAWFKRGQAFERMQAPLLALLHYNRITNLVRVLPECWLEALALLTGWLCRIPRTSLPRKR